VTITGGFLFLVPLVLTVLLVREVLQFARKLFAPNLSSNHHQKQPRTQTIEQRQGAEP
jgi:uncharacterized membrane protein